MNERTLSEIVSEIAPVLAGRPLGKIFQLTPTSIAIDFRLPEGRYLFISVEPARPRLYLIKRTVKDLEKSSIPPSIFVLSVRKHFSGARLREMRKEPSDRIVHFEFDGFDQAGASCRPVLVAQLTGRSSKLYALDENLKILATLRVNREMDLTSGAVYVPPPTPVPASLPAIVREPAFARAQFDDLSEAADHYYTQREDEQLFQARAKTELSRVKKELGKRLKLQQALRRDLQTHGDAEAHRRIGDLILANLSGATRKDGRVRFADYFAEGAPEIEIEVDDNLSLQDEAARRYQMYGKSKRAAQEIDRRLAELEKEISHLSEAQLRVETAIAERDYAAFPQSVEGGKQPFVNKSIRKKLAAAHTGLKRYRSSDGYEVLVGRGAQDNDRLTFRVARSHDLWLHAADYPGAHVVIVNHDRNHDVPQRTIIEAAQVAAYHSQAKGDAKVNIHYAQRKHISKPRGATPGMVRLSNFRTMLVEPSEAITRL